ncbi:uncharacterized protein [Amphiura filiformis]|uniref:uncharacterized protein n=1 Tax=Amphiura filiformis TaxID=82378 RepID=UPI003B20C9C0
MAEDPVTRVMMWCPPRSTSTAILKCLTYVPNSQVWCEPFLFADHCGPDGNFRTEFMQWLKDLWGVNDSLAEIKKIKGGFLAHDTPFSWIKEQLESSPPGIKVIFCKEMTWGFDNHYQSLPKGFKHTFLIRHPYKVFHSWKKMINRGMTDESNHYKLTDQPAFLLPKGYHFKEVYDMWKHVKETVEPNPVVVDVDDILSDPGRVLKAFCEAVGIPYSDDLLTWPAGRECMDEMWNVSKEEITAHNYGGHNMETFRSTGFIKPKPCPKREELDEDVLHCSDASMKYYQEMYENKLKC